MKIDFTGRHFVVDDQVRQYAEGKLDKLIKFLDEPVDVQVILEVEKRRQIAELNVTHRHGSLQATEAADDMLDAIHAVVDKAEKQARRARKKFMDKRRRARNQNHWPLEVLEASSFGTGVRPRVIKTTTLPIKPMTIEEAAMELDRSKNGFFVFLDSVDERVSVIYRREDNHYGLIAPEF
jgi:ribosome hibernation promoting factor